MLELQQEIHRDGNALSSQTVTSPASTPSPPLSRTFARRPAPTGGLVARGPAQSKDVSWKGHATIQMTV